MSTTPQRRDVPQSSSVAVRRGWLALALALAAMLPALAVVVAPATAAPTTISLTTAGNAGLYSPGYCGSVAPEGPCSPNQRIYNFTLPSPLTAGAVTSATLRLGRVGLYVQVPGPGGEAHFGLPPSTCTTAMTASQFALEINSSLVHNLGGVLTVYAAPGGPGGATQPAPYDIDVTNVVRASLGGPPGAGTFALQIRLVSPCNQGTFIFDLPTVDLTYETDTTPPTLSCVASPNQLSPPNHRLETVNVAVTATDPGGSGVAGVTLLSVVSNEPDNGQGDGDTAGDIQSWTVGTDDRSGQLRAERAGSGSGRVYTITYRATDNAGNATVASCTVTVPHDRRG